MSTTYYSPQHEQLCRDCLAEETEEIGRRLVLGMDTQQREKRWLRLFEQLMEFKSARLFGRPARLFEPTIYNNLADLHSDTDRDEVSLLLSDPKHRKPRIHIRGLEDYLTPIRECNKDIIPVNEYGRPTHRTKYDHPYSYDAFVVWRGGSNAAIDDSAYSDRLYEENPERFNRLCLKYFGDSAQFWDKRNPQLTEAFLREWLNLPTLRLILVMEMAKGNGYPCWRFDFAHC
jgi:hypothetical protein